MRTAVYTRVSSDIQVEEGFSLEAQLSRLRSYCESQDWTITGVYVEEARSAKDTERPMLQQMLEDIRNEKIDLVLVHRLDRLTRSVLDLHQLLQLFEKHHVGFRSATEVFDTTTATGRLFISLVASLAQWERENLAERVKFTMRELASQGKWLGGKAAFGYEYKDGKLEIDEIQAPTVREIFKRYLSGDGVRKLLQWLNDSDFPQPAPNKRWTLNALRYLLDNPLYAGFIRFGYRGVDGKRKAADTIISNGQHDPIIDEDTWQRVQQRREKRRTPIYSGRGTFSLTGLIRCGYCGSLLGGSTKYATNKREGPPYRYYICYEKAHSGLCKMPQISERKLEQAVFDQLFNHYEERNMTIGIAPELPSKADSRYLIDKSLEKIEKARKRWLQAYQEEYITAAELREQLDELSAERLVLENQINSEIERPQLDISKLLDVVKVLRESWEDATPEERRDMLGSLIERIEVMPGPEVRIVYRG